MSSDYDNDAGMGLCIGLAISIPIWACILWVVWKVITL